MATTVRKTSRSTALSSVPAPAAGRRANRAAAPQPAKTVQAAARPAPAAARKRSLVAAPAAPAAAKPAADKAAKPQKPAKPEKQRVKLVRDSFAMPEADFALIALLKSRAVDAKRPAKKSELLRAGLKALQALQPAQLVSALDALAPIKTGRPKKGS